jgi:hypothetical protein
MEKTFLILGVMVISAFGFIKAPSELKPAVQQTNMPIMHAPKMMNRVAGHSTLLSLPDHLTKDQQKAVVTKVNRDTVPKPKTKINRYSNVTTKSSDDGQNKVYEVEATDDAGKIIKLKKLNDELTELEVDGKKLEEGNNEFKEHLFQMEALERNATKELVEMQKMEWKEIKDKMELQKKEHEVIRKKMELQKKDFAKHEDEFKKKHKELQEMQMKSIPKMKEMQLAQIEAKKVMAIQKKAMIEERDMIKKRAEVVARQKPYKEENDEVNSIINDLSKRGLIKNPDVFSFTLSKKELMVNGEKGPGDLHQLLIEKYIKKNGDLFSYSKNGGSIATTINKE